jgi:FkbM family methyltransferase
MRLRLHPFIWGLLAPVKWWLRQDSWPRGKRLLRDKILMPLLPPWPASFTAVLSGDVRVRLGYRESTGFTTKLLGGFETAELELARKVIRPGSIIVDAGANIGIWTTCLAQASQAGRVWAFEPLAPNLERLTSHLAMNQLGNVDVHPIALGPTPGQAELLVPDDLAFASVVAPPRRPDRLECRVVPMRTLDQVWHAAGSPDVSLAKIDVEGSELGVLQGADSLLRSCRPTLIIEAPTRERLVTLATHLRPFGYRCSQPPGFLPWNYVFDASRTCNHG